MKRCDSFVEPLQLSLGFNVEMQKADTTQYILLYKTLNVLLIHQDALTEFLKSQEPTEDDNVFRTYHDGSAFKSNCLLNSERKMLEIVLYHDNVGIVKPLGKKQWSTKHYDFILCLEISLLSIDLTKKAFVWQLCVPQS